MKRAKTPYAKLFCRLSAGTMVVTVIIYILRGLRILTFLPGGIILLLFFSAIALGIMAKIADCLRC